VKERLRRELLAERRGLPAEEHARVSGAISDTLAGLPELQHPRTVLLYVAQPDEVDLATFAAARSMAGSRLVLPRVAGSELELRVRPTTREGISDARATLVQGLVAGTFGILEPPEGWAVIAASEVDLAIVPGVAFSPEGARLGRGGGFYDRLLARLRPDCLVVGVCGEPCLIPAVPQETHDRPVDLVITDASLWRRTATHDH
jgi:5-formyltetrahydrofolate cyclo-ligase